jgi:hypothetical protein
MGSVSNRQVGWPTAPYVGLIPYIWDWWPLIQLCYLL